MLTYEVTYKHEHVGIKTLRFSADDFAQAVQRIAVAIQLIDGVANTKIERILGLREIESED